MVMEIGRGQENAKIPVTLIGGMEMLVQLVIVDIYGLHLGGVVFVDKAMASFVPVKAESLRACCPHLYLPVITTIIIIPLPPFPFTFTSPLLWVV
jgi:hypothetical protein